MDVASATRVPWVDANGWRFEREPARAYFYDAPAGSAALAAAEALPMASKPAIRAAPEDFAAFARHAEVSSAKSTSRASREGQHRRDRRRLGTRWAKC